MNDQEKTQKQLIEELEELRQQVDRLKACIEDKPESENEPKQVQERWRSLVQNSPDRIMALNCDGTILSVNHNVADFTVEEVIGASVFNFVPGRFRRRMEDCFRQVTESQQPGGYLTDFRTAEGETRHFETRVSPVTDGDEVTALISSTREITDRKQIEENFERIFQQNPSPMALSSIPDRRVIDVNSAFLETTGYAREEILGRTSAELSLFPNSSEQAAVAESLRANGSISGFEQQLRRKDGSIRDVLFSGEIIQHSGHDCFLTVMVDVTGRKLAEEALADAQKLLEAAVAQSPSGIIIADAPDVSIRLANQAAFGIRGGDTSILTGIDVAKHAANWQTLRPDGSIYPSEQLPLSRAVLLGEVTRDEELIIRDEENTNHWINTNAAPVRNDKGEIIAGIVIFHDVTERKQVEEELLKEKEFSNAAISSLPGTFYVCNQQGAFLHWNSKFTTVSGYSDDEVSSMLAEQFVIPEEVANLRESMREVFVNESGLFETVLLSKDGTRTPYILTGARFDVDGQPCLIGMGIDISDRKRAEEERQSLEAQVQHSQKLESLGILAGGIAHDFNNLMMPILGHAGLALQDLSPVSSVRPNIQEIERAAARAADLAKQMLAYSGKGHFVVAPLTISEVVAEMAHLLESSISKKARLTMRLKSDIPAIVADLAQVQQVVMNLITNASDAIGEDNPGIITASTGVKRCSREYLATSYLDETQPEGDYVYFEVTDTGYGMDEETRSKIFDPFFSTKFTGRGLGLAATLGIVRGHRGAIIVESEIGAGTTFRVLFPAAAEEVKKSEPTNAVTKQDVWRGTGTVLVVDDDEAVRRLAVTMVERLGFETIQAANGQEGVELFEKNAETITCVLLDLTMPRMDGGEACLAMQNIRDDVPIVLSSGYEESELSKRFHGYRMAAFIQKPFQLAKLQMTFQSVLE